MKKIDHYSGIGPETIQILSMKIKDLSREHEKMFDFLRGTSNYLYKVDLLNQELAENKNLFQIIDKDKYLKKHLHKSFTATRLLKDWLEEINGLSTEGIILSFEKLDSLILESIELIEYKLKLEDSFNQNQSNHKN
tara:strand:- start:147 stop:554 length:408 start_codon:yes stop_codon:yes gene_type:complete